MNIDIATLVIIGVTALISFKGFQDPAFFERFKFLIGGIKNGEQVRFISSGFLHVDLQHLAFNMITLFFFADIVVTNLGTVPYLIIYMASLLAGNFLSYSFHKDENYYSAVGASGAVSGILYAAILLDPSRDLYLFFIPIGIPGYVFAIGYLLYSIYGMKSRRDNIGHDAHFGGAVAGFLTAIIYDTNILFEQTLIVAALLIPIAILFIMKLTGRI